MTFTLLKQGERVSLSRYTAEQRLTLTPSLSMPGETDLSLFGLDEARRLSDDRYFIFYNQLHSPEGAMTLDLKTGTFSIDLGRIPLGVHRLLLAATTENQAFSQLKQVQVTLSAAGSPVLRFDVDSGMFRNERAVMLVELYRHQGEWRIAGVGQGFSGGLQALLESLGGEVAEPAPVAPAQPQTRSAAPAPSPARPSGSSVVSPSSTAWAPLTSAPEQGAGANHCRRCGTAGGFLHRLNAQGYCRNCARAIQTGLERFRVRFQAACADGIMELHEWQDLQETVLRENIGADQALTLVRPEAIRLLERTVAVARADGQMGVDDEEGFHRLRRLLEVPDTLISGLLADLYELKQATQIREGHLPTVRSALILEAGEVAHLEMPAMYRHVTATRMRDIQGRLTLTSKQMRFSSQTDGGWDVQYSKVLRIDEVSGGVSLELGVKKGVGLYRVERPLMLAATLDALVRLNKRLMLTPQSERASRHIPHDVRIQVWQHDQGKCRECGDANYLEYDHIIPFSKGGASTFGNLQLLCRRCNLAKGDRL